MGNKFGLQLHNKIWCTVYEMVGLCRRLMKVTVELNAADRLIHKDREYIGTVRTV
jgi:hypothetical protein